MSVTTMLQAQSRGGLTVYPVEALARFGVNVFVTDRFGGVSSGSYESLNLGDHVEDDTNSVLENRKRVALAMNVDLAKLVIIRQVHGNVVADGATASSTTEADGLFTDRNDLALAMLVADCIPIALVDESSDRFAVVHAGWRGLQSGVIASALRVFASPQHVHAFLGPSISPHAYQISGDVAHYFDDVGLALTPDGDDHFRLDLRRVAEQQLLDGGVQTESIIHAQQVTDGGEVFFSDRAQRPCGRFAIVAKLAS